MTPSRAVGRVLDVDPDLGAGIAPNDWELARQACRGELVHVPPGVWSVPDWLAQRDDLFGLVVAEGVMCREVALHDRHMLELLAPGDVLQLPVLAERPRLGGPVHLTAVAETRLVGLSGAFARAVARWPCLLAAVHRRLEAQRERLAIQGLIAHLPRAEHRVLLTLWHLAEGWGRVVPEGTLLPLTLTHDVLGQLSAARRSTVTLAVVALEADGYVIRLPDGAWLLPVEAEHRVEAIARTGGNAHVLGETFRLRQRMIEVQDEARAVRAEAGQLRSRGRQSGLER